MPNHQRLGMWLLAFILIVSLVALGIAVSDDDYPEPITHIPRDVGPNVQPGDGDIPAPEG